ncbi:hypothetical protein [Iodobacter sp.]|uniref:hypothetical protein n=1 Tax=Iodobacter sp. TaxID=1915058 RepID=UPI0025FC898D|nr:hypothetical protein [Iodobacter sp.]
MQYLVIALILSSITLSGCASRETKTNRKLSQLAIVTPLIDDTYESSANHRDNNIKSEKIVLASATTQCQNQGKTPVVLEKKIKEAPEFGVILKFKCEVKSSK